MQRLHNGAAELRATAGPISADDIGDAEPRAGRCGRVEEVHSSRSSASWCARLVSTRRVVPAVLVAAYAYSPSCSVCWSRRRRRAGGVADREGGVFRLFAHVRRARLAPLHAHMSAAHALDKANHKLGPAGLRLVFGQCTFWKCWFKRLLIEGRSMQGRWPQYMHGFVAFRRRSRPRMSTSCMTSRTLSAVLHRRRC